MTDHTTERPADIEQRLYLFATNWVKQPREFDWPTANCGRFAADWVLQCEGFDPLDRLPPTPSAKAAARVIYRYGGMAGAVSYMLGDAHLPRQTISAQLAKAGDLVLIPPSQPGELGTVGISCGALVIVRAGDSLTLLHTHAAETAWRLRCAA